MLILMSIVPSFTAIYFTYAIEKIGRKECDSVRVRVCEWKVSQSEMQSILMFTADFTLSSSSLFEMSKSQSVREIERNTPY